MHEWFDLLIPRFIFHHIHWDQLSGVLATADGGEISQHTLHIGGLSVEDHGNIRLIDLGKEMKNCTWNEESERH